MKGLRRQLHLYLVVSTIIYLAALSAVSLEQWTENQCRYKDSSQVLGRGGASASASVGRCVVLCPCPGLRNSPGLGGCLCRCRHPCSCYRLPTNYLLWAELGWGDIPQCGGGESDGRDMGQCDVRLGIEIPPDIHTHTQTEGCSIAAAARPKKLETR